MNDDVFDLSFGKRLSSTVKCFLRD